MILYIVPDIKKISGGPRSRIQNFKNVFKEKDEEVIEGGWSKKLISVLQVPSQQSVYVEMASNRLFFIDFICLNLLKLKKSKIIPFIRDIYIELIPDEYKSFRGRITKLLNKLSNRFVCSIAHKVVFPTKEMGELYFKKNTFKKDIKFDELPPGCFTSENIKLENQKVKDQMIGLVFLGGINYSNSGILNYLEIARELKVKYRFYVLTQDSNIFEILNQNQLEKDIVVDHISFKELEKYFILNNIKFAIHSRSRSEYDDLTFPIKILDLISLKIPFFTEKHIPIANLMGKEYPLFQKLKEIEQIEEKLRYYSKDDHYKLLINSLELIQNKNLYENRYRKLLKMFNNE